MFAVSAHCLCVLTGGMGASQFIIMSDSGLPNNELYNAGVVVCNCCCCLCCCCRGLKIWHRTTELTTRHVHNCQCEVIRLCA
jgi:hypothetical protein